MTMKKFRGKEVIGWKTITKASSRTFDEAVNKLMEEYDFEDYQFSTDRENGYAFYSASILLRNKE